MLSLNPLLWLTGCTAAGAFGVWLVRAYALERKWLDLPNERSFHQKPVPRIGGIGILVPVVLSFAAMIFLPLTQPALVWMGPLLPALLVALLSFFDDRFELSRLVRFSGHAACAVLLLILLHHSWIGAPLPLLGDRLPAAVVAVLLLVWITGLTNSYNFMDGIDGIAAIQGLVAVAGWTSVVLLEPSLAGNGTAQLLMLLALAGGLTGFLLLNWAPASIFMGDIGSTFLGFYFAALPFGAAAAGLPFDRALEAGVLFVWPFVADAGMTFGRRVVRRERIFNAHRTHLYQVLAATFPSRDHGHRVTSLVFGGLALAGVGLYWSSGPLWAKLAVLGWLWLAMAAWTFGIRRQKSASLQNSGSTGAATGAEICQLSPPKGQFMPFDIFLSPPEITEAEHRMVLEALSSGFIAPVGPQVNTFERGLSEYLGLEDVQALSSGTAAIHLGLRALGVGPGDCVLCPDLTFIASVNPVRYLGAEPVLVDVEADTWSMDPQLAREAIRTLKKEGRTVRAMVVVHAFGIPANMEPLMALAREEGVLVLEDCAGAFGTRIGGRFAGSYGDAAAYSFNGNKVLTTSGGGALYVREPRMRKEARNWANQGKQTGAIGYQHETLGYNYKLSNICAAIGLAQLSTVDGRLARKEAVFRGYQKRLAGVAQIRFMPEPAYGKNNFWLTSIAVDSSTHSEEIVMALRSQRIEASPMWKPMQQQGINRDLRAFGGEASKRIYQRNLSLPSGSALTEDDLDRVCEVVRGQLLTVAR